jgi:flagellar hook-length control protein FliK
VKLSGASALKAGAPGPDGAAFKAQLDGSFGALFSGAKTDAAATTAAPAPITLTASKDDAKLAQAVKDLLDRGIALGDVVAHLASSLATSVAAQLGISPQAALQRLTQAFTQALQSTGTGPPGTNADRASALVSRFRRIAELATGVVNADPGQPIRTIAGTSLDAVTAKANPAPTADTILRSALDALAAPASPATDPALAGSPAAAPAPSPVAPATGDGRTVALDPSSLAAAGFGGDTQLGRILTRALLVDAQTSAPAAVTPVDAAAKRVTNAAATPAGAMRVAPDTSPNAVNDVLDGFVRSFTNAVAQNWVPPYPDSNPNVPNDVLIAPVSTRSEQITLPYAIPVAHENVPVAPLAPAPASPQPQHADANAVVDQILRGMAIRTTDGQSEVRLRLVPENLGDVSVKLVVSGGSVDASIVAHTADAQTALAGGQNQLAKTLADAGLKLQSFTVGLAGDFTGNRDQSRPNDSQTRSAWRRIGGLESVDVDEPVDTALLAVPSFGPPIYAANPALRNLNYLV